MRSLLCFATLVFPCIIFGKMREITIPHPLNGDNKIEFLWSQPEGEGKFPLVVLLHGTSAKFGAKSFTQETVAYWVKRGAIVVTISLPGYGKTDGLNDFAGPYSMAAVAEVITFLREQAFVDKERIALIGFGIGGTIATILSAKELNLSYVVSVNGGYDILAHNHPSDPVYIGIEKLGSFPINEDELSIRSPMNYISKIGAPLLLFHRMITTPIPEEEVIAFQTEVLSRGGNCTTRFLPYNGDIRIPHDEIADEIAVYLTPILGLK